MDMEEASVTGRLEIPVEGVRLLRVPQSAQQAHLRGQLRLEPPIGVTTRT